MKTMIKLIALACAAFFVVAACSAPDAELTERNFKDVDKGKYDTSTDPNSTTPAAYKPTITTNNSTQIGSTWDHDDWYPNYTYDYYGNVWVHYNDSSQNYTYVRRDGFNAGINYTSIFSDYYKYWTWTDETDTTNDTTDNIGNLSYGSWETTDPNYSSLPSESREETDDNYSGDGFYNYIDYIAYALNTPSNPSGSQYNLFRYEHSVPVYSPLYESTVDSESDYAKEVHIKFKNGADVLTSGNIESALKEFLKFKTFTNPAPSEDDKASAVSTSEIGYSYVNSSNTPAGFTTITVRLASVPDKNLVAVIDGTKYTVGGYPVEFVEGEAGNAIYNDVYEQIKVSKNGTPATEDTFIEPGNKALYITYDISPAGNTFTDASSTAQKEKTITISLIDSYGDISNAARQAALDAIASKFKVQQFNSGSWSTLASFSKDSTNPNANLTAKITMTDLLIVRVYGEGLDNLKTSADLFGVKQKISVNGSYNNKVYASVVSVYRNSDNHKQYTAFSDIFDYTTDSKGQNIVFTVRFNLPVDANGKNVQLTPMSLESLNKAFKIIPYSSLVDINAVNSKKDINFVKINSVEYIKDRRDATLTTKDEINCIKFTLDPNVKWSSNMYYLVSPSFKFADNKQYYGDYSNVNVVIDDERFFAFGQLTH